MGQDPFLYQRLPLLLEALPARRSAALRAVLLKGKTHEGLDALLFKGLSCCWGPGTSY